jgi:hypothetical protein
MTIRLSGTHQLMTVPKGEKGDPGSSVRIVGSIEGLLPSIPSQYSKIDMPVYAIESPFCLYWWEESQEQYMQVVPEEGDGYLVESKTGNNSEDGYMYVASGWKWKGPYQVQGPKGDDGTDGQDAALFRLKMDEAWAKWKYSDSDGELELEAAASGRVVYVKGNTELPLSSATEYSDYRVIVVFYGRRVRTDLCTLESDGSWSAPESISGWKKSSYPYLNYISIELQGSNSSGNWQTLESASISIVTDGNTGKQGDIGPMGLPAGAYNETARYTRTQKIVPIVEHNDEYWYPRNIGTLTNSEPSANNADWEKAENFSVMFVKILFAAFAHLGEAIFHGKYMFSQRGIVNGASSSNYEKFDPDNPDDEENANRFAPNLYMNFLTGAARLAAGNAKFHADGTVDIKGIIHALGGTFKGVVKADLMYSPVKVLGSEESLTVQYTIDPVEEPYHTYYGEADKDITITLPESEDFDGLELQFFHLPGTRSGRGYMAVKGSNIIYDEDGQTMVFSSVGDTKLFIEAGSLATLKAIGYRWILVAGKVHT